MIVTNKRLLFLLPSGSVWFGPAGHLARAVVGAKGYLEKHGKTENTDELDHHVLRNLLMDCSYFRGYLIDEIRDIHILNRGSAFEIELLNGRKDHFLLDSEGFEGEIDSSLSKLKALLNTA
jgi:hypothetical protein